MVVVRHDGLNTGELRQLAAETVRALGSGVVGLVGSSNGKAAIAVAVSKDVVARGAAADAIGRPAATLLDGNISKGAELAVGGGKNAAALDDARSRHRLAASRRPSGGQ